MQSIIFGIETIFIVLIFLLISRIGFKLNWKSNSSGDLNYYCAIFSKLSRCSTLESWIVTIVHSLHLFFWLSHYASCISEGFICGMDFIFPTKLDLFYSLVVLVDVFIIPLIVVSMRLIIRLYVYYMLCL